MNDTHRALKDNKCFNSALRPIIQPKPCFLFVLEAKPDLPYHSLYSKLENFVKACTFIDQFLLVNCKHNGKTSCHPPSHNRTDSSTGHRHLQQAHERVREEIHTCFRDKRLVPEKLGGRGHTVQFASPNRIVCNTSIQINRTVIDPDTGILLYLRSGYDSPQHRCKWFATVYGRYCPHERELSPASVELPTKSRSFHVGTLQETSILFRGEFSN